MELIPAGHDDASLARYAALMQACFPGAGGKFSVDYLRWLYRENPDGTVVGFDAMEGDTLAAHYACVPAAALLEGAPARMLLSLNTATHPSFQGKGLFTRLAQKTYEAGDQQGFDAVYGVANANSTPGFTRKLGFQLATPLQARVGIGRLGGAAPRVDSAASFRRTRTAQSFAWRCANPYKAVHVRRQPGLVQCFAPIAGTALAAYHEYPEGEMPGGAASATAPVLRLFLGLLPAPGVSARYVPIPQRLRPSPLNLIYKPLRSGVVALDPARVSFSFLDFDAY